MRANEYELPWLLSSKWLQLLRVNWDYLKLIVNYGLHRRETILLRTKIHGKLDQVISQKEDIQKAIDV